MPRGIDGGLDHDAADGGDGILETHGQAHEAENSRPVPAPAAVGALHAEDGKAPAHAHQAADPRPGLGQDGSQGGAEYVQVEHQDKEEVQENVGH